MSNDFADVPWSGGEGAGAPRRKVAWGNGAGYDESSAPRPRTDAPPPPPTFGDAFRAAVLSDEASATAYLHAGQPEPEAPAPAVPGAEPLDLSSVFDDAFGDDLSEAREPTEAAPTADTTGVTADDALVTVAAGADLSGADTAHPEGAGAYTGFVFHQEAPGPGSAEAPAAAPVPRVGALADLGGLFDEPATGPTPASYTAPEAGPVQQPAPSQRHEEGAHAVVVPSTELDPGPERPGPEVPATPGEAPRSYDLAARRAALEAARQTNRAPTTTTTGPDLSARYAHSEELYDTVDRILGLGRGGDPGLQATIKHLVLTRDNALDREQRAAYQMMLEPRLATAGIQIASAAERDVIFDIAYDELLGIGPLGPLWRDDTVDEIMVSGPGKVSVERRGRLELTPVRFRNQTHLEQTGRTLAGASGDDRAVSSNNPLVTVQLDRARVQFVWKPLAVAGVAMTIRKFGDLMDLGQLLELGSLSEEMAAFLQDAVTARATLLVSGGTGSGKTTFINAVSEFIPDDERVVTIEDALELQLRNTHIERLVTKEAASADDTNLFGQDQLLKASLRMRPDRIIVGEVRDGKAASVMLEAANTGHDGTMTTIHANGPEHALGRLSMLLRRVESMPDDVARAEVATAINVVVQIVRKNRRRFVSHIAVVDSATSAATAATHGFGVTNLFVGDFAPNTAAPQFRRVQGLRPDTELAIKMTDAGIDPAVWE